jgi:hypothetical protein
MRRAARQVTASLAGQRKNLVVVLSMTTREVRLRLCGTKGLELYAVSRGRRTWLEKSRPLCSPSAATVESRRSIIDGGPET